MGKGKKTILISVAVFLAIYLANYVTLQRPLSNVINSDPRNEGIILSAHYGYYVYPSELVIDVKDVRADRSASDMFRVLVQYAKELETRSFEWVKLASKGKTKFLLKGRYFNILGEEYGTQNPVYTIRTFPENVYSPDGLRAFDSWTGGVIGVMGKQMEDFIEFHKQWYIEDMD
ncbi:hypothetical protein ACFL34_03725 [Candidatus Sumerlaeota bacterium]